MSATNPISTVLKNLKLLNVSNNNIVHARHSHFSTLEKLDVLDLSNNRLHCDDGFKNLIQWLKDRKVSAVSMSNRFLDATEDDIDYSNLQIKAGNVHAGFNAELNENGQIVDSAASYSLGWDSFATNVCAQSHQPANAKVVEKAELPEEIIDDDNGDDDDDEGNDIDDASMLLCLFFLSALVYHVTFPLASSIVQQRNKRRQC